MTILRINACVFCKGRGVLTERAGGWTVDCYYADALNSVQDNRHLCGTYYADYMFALYETPNEAINEWNKINEQPEKV